MSRDGAKSSWNNPWVWGGVGCCLGCVVLPILLVAGGVGTAFFVAKRAGGDELKARGIEQASHDPAVIAVLGEPIEAGWARETRLDYNNGRPFARYRLPLTGPNGTGHLIIEGIKDEGRWEFSRLALIPESTGDAIELVDPSGQGLPSMPDQEPPPAILEPPAEAPPG